MPGPLANALLAHPLHDIDNLLIERLCDGVISRAAQVHGSLVEEVDVEGLDHAGGVAGHGNEHGLAERAGAGGNGAGHGGEDGAAAD